MSTEPNSIPSCPDDPISSSPMRQVKGYHVEFYKLCYQQYVNEFARTDQFHQKTGLWLTAMLAIGAASYALGRTDLIEQVRTDVFIFLFYCATVLVWLSLAFGTYSVFQTLRLRSTLMIATMDQWHQWLEQVDNKDNPPDEDRMREISDTLTLDLIRNFAKCQSDCHRENVKRADWFKKLQYSVFLSALFIAIQAFSGVLTIIVK